VHCNHRGEDLGILGYSTDHWWSAEGGGGGPRWGPIFMGCVDAHMDDDAVELVSTCRLR
jgi:hypothetical protein